MSSLATALAGCVALIATAAVAAAMLRRSAVPGSAVIGGLLAGLLLGPTIAGRLAPRAWEQVYVGGQAERETRDGIIARRGADAFVVSEIGAEDAARRTLLAETEAALRDARNAWAEATWVHQAPLRWTALLAAGAALLLAGAAAVPRDGPAPATASVASMAAWSAGVPAAVVVSILHLGDPQELPETLLVAAAVVIGPFVLTGTDRSAAESAELGGARLVQAAGRVASVIAIITAGVGLAMAGRAGYAVVLLALPLGWWGPRGPRAVAVARDSLLVPALAAVVAVKVDLLADLAFWPLIALLLASGDGRWVGATLGGMLTGGRRWLRTMRLVMGSMACGPTQLAVAAVALHVRALTPGLGLAILAGAALIELSTPMRRRMTARLAAMEQELDDLGGEP